MLFKERKEFTFTSKALPEDTFSVVKFSGVEAISKPYEFDITLASEDPEIDLKAVLQNPVILTIVHGDEELLFHGILARFEQLHEVKQHAFYHAVLVPKLWKSGLYHENQLFLDKTVPQIIEEVLKQAGMAGLDYEFNLTRNYPSWEYICQYRETDLNFISRWMEREGIYYFFEQSEQGAKMIISDSLSIHKDIVGESSVPYSPPSGLIASEGEIVKEFVCRQKILPAKVILKDHNYRNPSLEVKAEAEVDPDGRGEVFIYGEHFKSPGEGDVLAKVRAEALLCREREFHGESTAPAFTPGFTFELTGHYRSEYNRKYLIVEIKHEGSRSEDLLAGLGEKQSELEAAPGYTNRFMCIPANVQFRPELMTPKSRFYGSMNAVVDAAGDGQFAELDDQGRYKVILPFDLSGRSGGKASRFIRMAQPYSGSEYGMHFPLHKGAEVFLSFVDGDPDRPFISGTVPNPENKSPVTTDNQARSIIRDNAGNEAIFDTEPGKEHIWLYSPNHNSSVSIGKSVSLFTDSNLDSVAGGVCNEWVGGFKTETVLGSKSELLVGAGTDIAAGSVLEASLGWTTSVNANRKVEVCAFDDVSMDRDDYYKQIGECGLIDAENLLQLEAGTDTSRNCRIKMNDDAIAIEKFVDVARVVSRWKKAGIFALIGAAVAAAVASTAQAAMVPAMAKTDENAKETGNWVNTFVVGGVQTLTNALAVVINMLLKNRDVKEIARETDGKTCHARIELKKSGDIDIDSMNKVRLDSKDDLWVRSMDKDVNLAAPKGEIFIRSSLKHKNFEIL
jgi:type VI secretion system secreted protein VgrG